MSKQEEQIDFYKGVLEQDGFETFELTVRDYENKETADKIIEEIKGELK